MDDGGEVTRIELGGGRRRWWPVVLAAVAAWVVLAAVVSSRGDDGGAKDGAAMVRSTTTTTERATTTTRRPPRTTTTTTLPPGPLLGRETGWQLIITEGGPMAGSVVDLDSGATSPFPGAGIFAARADGAIVMTQTGDAVWAPVPFDDASRVILQPLTAGGAYFAGRDEAWIVGYTSDTGTLVSLVSLVDGSELTSYELPPPGWVVGALGDSLVIEAAGDAYVLEPRRAPRQVADGRPMAVVGDQVLVNRCDEALRCEFVVVDPATGDAAVVPGLDTNLYPISNHPQAHGWLLAGVPSAGTPFLVNTAGEQIDLSGVVSSDRAWQVAWSPDESLLFVPDPRGVSVIDPFASGGPAQVAVLPLPTGSGGSLAVVGPAP